MCWHCSRHWCSIPRMLHVRMLTAMVLCLWGVPMVGKGKGKGVEATSLPPLTTVISPIQEPESELCHVCCEGESTEENAILYCEVRSLPMHAAHRGAWCARVRLMYACLPMWILAGL